MVGWLGVRIPGQGHAMGEEEGDDECGGGGGGMCVGMYRCKLVRA